MKRLFFIILVAVAAWYGWKHYRELFQHTPSHDAVIENRSSHEIQRLRFTADGQTQVKESLPAGESVTFQFKVNHDSSLELNWEWGDKLGERHWTGGSVAHGPMVGKHVMSIDDDGEVTYTPQPK